MPGCRGARKPGYPSTEGRDVWPIMLKPERIYACGDVERLLARARHTRGADAFHTSLALDLLAPVPGCTWLNICVWCLERSGADVPNPYVFRLDKRDDWCARCAYHGVDVLIVPIPREPGQLRARDIFPLRSREQ